MTVIPGGYVNQEKLAGDVERVVRKLGPEVVRVKFDVGADPSDEPAIHFRIVLTDSASREENLADVRERITRIFFDDLRPYENWGSRLYFSFRSQSEQSKRSDTAWA